MVPLAWFELRGDHSRQNLEQRKPGNVVTYLAPSFTLKCESHSYEEIEAKTLTTL